MITTLVSGWLASAVLLWILLGKDKAKSDAGDTAGFWGLTFVWIFCTVGLLIELWLIPEVAQ